MASRNLPSSQFEEFFDKRSGALNFLLSREELFPPPNEQLYAKYFPMAEFPVPIQPDGSALFTGGTITAIKAPMLNPRGTWSEPSEYTKGGFEAYVDALHDLGGKITITAQQEENYERKSQLLQNTSVSGAGNIIDFYIQNLQDLVKGGHSTYTYLSMQMLSKGEWEFDTPNYGFKINGKCSTIRPYFKIKASTLMWSDPDAPILEDLQRAVKLIRDKTGYEGVLTAKMSRSKFIEEVQTNNIVRKTLLQNQLLASLGMGGYDPNMVLTIEMLNNWLAQQNGYYPLIELIEESQVIQDLPSVKIDVHGWAKEMVIVSPAGAQGTTEWAIPSELAYLRKYPNFNVATLFGGLFGVLTRLVTDTRIPQKQTELLTLGAPALLVFDKWVQIDTSQVEL